MTCASTTSSDGTQIAFQVSGSGDALILLHGLPGSASGWRDAGYVSTLERDFCVIAMESRGHGASGKPHDPAAYRFERIAADIMAVADACGAATFRCLGSSWGANAALRLTACTNRVERVVSIGGVFGIPISEDRANTARTWWEQFIDARQTGRLNELGLSDEELEELRVVDPQAVLAAALGLKWWPSLEPEQLSIPTLLIVGGEDERVLRSLAVHREGISRAGIQAVILDGVDHRKAFERSELTLPLIQAFLR
jgi:pimeloyl-ACP methyl ester carboxylesterase